LYVSVQRCRVVVAISTLPVITVGSPRVGEAEALTFLAGTFPAPLETLVTRLPWTTQQPRLLCISRSPVFARQLPAPGS